MEDVEMKDVQMKDLEMKDMEMKDVEMKDMEMKDAEMKDAEMNVAHPFNSLICELLFPYLERKDLLAASLVCKTWNRMAFDKLLWKTVKIDDCKVVKWNKMVNFINRRGTVCLDTRETILPESNTAFETYWQKFQYAIKHAKKIKKLYLHNCPPFVVETVIKELTKIESLDILVMIKNPLEYEYEYFEIEYITVNLNGLEKLKNLTEFRINGIYNMVYTPPPTLASLLCLNTLQLSSIYENLDDIWNSIKTVNTKSLKHLEIGFCNNMKGELDVFLTQLLNLSYLKVESYTCQRHHNATTINFFHAIKNLKNLQSLELVDVVYTVIIECELEKCVNLKQLSIVPTFSKNPANVNHFLIAYLLKFKNKLEKLEIGLQPVVDMHDRYFLPQIIDKGNLDNYFDIPIQTRTMQLLKGCDNTDNLNTAEKPIIIISNDDLENLISKVMPNTKVDVYTLPPTLQM